MMSIHSKRSSRKMIACGIGSLQSLGKAILILLMCIICFAGCVDPYANMKGNHAIVMQYSDEVDYLITHRIHWGIGDAPILIHDNLYLLPPDSKEYIQFGNDAGEIIASIDRYKKSGRMNVRIFQFSDKYYCVLNTWDASSIALTELAIEGSQIIILEEDAEPISIKLKKKRYPITIVDHTLFYYYNQSIYKMFLDNPKEEIFVQEVGGIKNEEKRYIAFECGLDSIDVYVYENLRENGYENSSLTTIEFTHGAI